MKTKSYWLNIMYLPLLFCMMLSIATPALAANQQETPVTIHMDDTPLRNILSSIENQTGYTFVYSVNDIDDSEAYTLHVDSENIFATLQKLFENRTISFVFSDKQIVLNQTTTVAEASQPRRVRITGTVKDSQGEPLPGVNVYVKEGGAGTITGNEGSFSIMARAGHTLVFSFVGYTQKEHLVTQETSLAVTLNEKQQEIEELVVIGYGEQSKALVSSAVGVIDNAALTEAPTSNLSEALQGRATGVRVMQNSGTPGAGISVRIRGVSSINAGAEPLYVIDGVPLITDDFGQIGFSGQGINSISDINPADIQSISILKDASATAIYGARASNGVVLITTKKGKLNQNQIDFSSRFGYQQVINKLDMLNAEEFMRYKNEASINDGGVALYSEDEIASNTIDTDWLDKIFRTAPLQDYNLSVSGGANKTRYYISGNYFDQQGIVLGTDYSKLSGRVNIDQEVTGWLDVGATFGVSRSENSRKEGDQSLNGPVPNAISMPPILPVKNEDGTFNDNGPLANPVSIATLHTNKAYNARTLGNFYGTANLTDNLTFQSKYGYDMLSFREHTYDPVTTRQGAKYNGLGLESTTEAIRTVWSNTLNYDLRFDQHKINLLAGAEFEKNSRRSTYMRGQDFPSPELEYIVSAASIILAEATAADSRLNSFFGRSNYNLDNTYLLTLNLRADGSSNFGENNKYGFFPSGDFAWRISQEEFFPAIFINDLKLRTSYGLTGNDGIPAFSYMPLFGSGRDYENQPGIAISQIPNQDLRWETTAQTNVGINIGMWNSRFELVTDLYYKKTTDLLLNRPIPPSSGFSSVTENIGEMINKGLEIGINADLLTGPLQWTVISNTTFNRNKVTKLYGNQPLDNIGRGGNRVEEDEPISIFYGWKSLGVDPTTGDLVFHDKDGNGVIDENDRMKIGDPHPIFAGGFENILNYRGIRLSFFFQYSYGNDVFNGTRRYIEVMKGVDNQTAAVLRRWQEPGDITDVPRATNADPNANDRMSSRFVEDGSYLKLKNLRLSYNLPGTLLERVNIRRLEVYLIGQNLFTITKYSGMDPEVNYAGQDILRMGTDFFTYPQAKSFSIGLNLGF